MDSPELEPVEGGEFLWDWYKEISRFRAMGQNGPVPLTPRDIREWREMSGTIVRREECDILLDLDQAYRAAWHEEAASQNAARQDRDSRSKPPTPTRRR